MTLPAQKQAKWKLASLKRKWISHWLLLFQLTWSTSFLSLQLLPKFGQLTLQLITLKSFIQSEHAKLVETFYQSIFFWNLLNILSKNILSKFCELYLSNINNLLTRQSQHPMIKSKAPECLKSSHWSDEVDQEYYKSTNLQIYKSTNQIISI